MWCGTGRKTGRARRDAVCIGTEGYSMVRSDNAESGTASFGDVWCGDVGCGTGQKAGQVVLGMAWSGPVRHDSEELGLVGNGQEWCGFSVGRKLKTVLTTDCQHHSY